MARGVSRQRLLVAGQLGVIPEVYAGYGLVSLVNRLALHDEPSAAAVRVIVGGPVPVMRPIAQIVRAELEVALLLRDLFFHLI